MEATLREFVDQLPVLVRRPDGEILLWTEGCRELFGYTGSEAKGRPAQHLLQTVFPENPERILTALRTHGEWTGRLRHKTKDGRLLWTLAVLRLRNHDGSAGAVVIEQNTDISSQVELEEQRDLLAGEMEHRIKNLLSITQAIARNNFPDANPDQMDKFQRRLAALGNANRLLREGSWEGTDLRQLAEEVTRALGIEERVHLRGPDVPIGSEQATGLALAIHELSTNAVKYGALSTEKGHVSLTWSIDFDGVQVTVRWVEKGGPAPPSQRLPGFGMNLIRRAIPGAAPARLAFEPDGVSCEMRLLLSSAARVGKAGR